ncbi:MAG: dTDP-4-dehydrorhamnose 3,5-epimerase [Bacteroidota bacterium]|jgi:dTDP-4-dehydrorhamnose 3,5-epimerase
MVRIQEEKLQGLYSVYPTVYTDDRGYFFESFKASDYAPIAKGLSFVQDNVSKSVKGTLRGLHFQKEPYAQGKLVQVLQGAVLDVAVDLRKSSPTYGEHFKIMLSGANAIQLYIPPGFAHGFLALEDDTIFSYKCTAPYHQASEGCLLWNDPDLDIDWGSSNLPFLSAKDAAGLAFKTFQTPFE